MHQTINPAILYFGTPVILLSTINEDGSANLAPFSSAWWLGHRCVLGLGSSSKTTENLIRTKQCVINLPSIAQVDAVDRLALTTGSNPVPDKKSRRGYKFIKDKFGISQLTPMRSEVVSPPRVYECPVHMEAELYDYHEMSKSDPIWAGRTLVLETRVLRVHVEEALILSPFKNRINPDQWQPLIMSFQQFYGLTADKLSPSRLASISEECYRP